MTEPTCLPPMKQGSNVGVPSVNSPARLEEGEPTPPGSVNSGSSSSLAVPGARDLPPISTATAAAAMNAYGMGNNESPSQRESFLNYFFGGANKTDRPALGSQEMLASSKYVPPMSMNSIIDAEMERKFETVSCGEGASFVCLNAIGRFDDTVTDKLNGLMTLFV